MWEYNRIVIQYKNSTDLIEKLNILGNDNWEIISFDDKPPKKYGDFSECVILFKRIKNSDNKKMIL